MLQLHLRLPVPVGFPVPTQDGGELNHRNRHFFLHVAGTRSHRNSERAVGKSSTWLLRRRKRDAQRWSAIAAQCRHDWEPRQTCRVSILHDERLSISWVSRRVSHQYHSRIVQISIQKFKFYQFFFVRLRPRRLHRMFDVPNLFCWKIGQNLLVSNKCIRFDPMSEVRARTCGHQN